VCGPQADRKFYYVIVEMWWLVIVLVALAVCLVVLRVKSNFQSEIPKTIWTYWVEENPPEIVQKCIESWKKHNPDYDVHLLNKNTVSRWVPELELNDLKHNDGPTRESDFTRLSVLSKYGGFWVDASIIMNGSLEPIRQIQAEKGCEMVGYYIHDFTTRSEYPVIENWFFACVPGSAFVQQWRDEFMSLNTHNTVNDYINAKKKAGVDLQRISSPEYLAMHVSAQTVMQKLMSIEDVSKKLHLMKAEDGPFKYLVYKNWNSAEALKSLCDVSELRTPLIKLRGTERRALNEKEDLKCILETF
jgi:hypothetical protein